MTPAFDIVPAELDTTQLSHYLLLMEVGEHHFSYLIYDRSQKNAIGLRQYSLEATHEKTNLDILEEIISGDPLLQQPTHDTVVIYNYSDSTLLPEKFFHIELNKPLAELEHGTIKKGLVLSEKVHNWGMYNVYRIPREVHSMLQKRFAAGKYWHSNSLLLSLINKNNIHSPVMSLVVYSSKFSIYLFNDRQLLLMQTFTYETPEDVSYYMLLACRQFNLSQEKIQLRLSGLVDEESALYQEILKYFVHIKWENVPDSLSADAITAAHPKHYFSPLLRMTVCV